MEDAQKNTYDIPEHHGKAVNYLWRVMLEKCKENVFAPHSGNFLTVALEDESAFPLYVELCHHQRALGMDESEGALPFPLYNPHAMPEETWENLGDVNAEHGSFFVDVSGEKHHGDMFQVVETTEAYYIEEVPGAILVEVGEVWADRKTVLAGLKVSGRTLAELWSPEVTEAERRAEIANAAMQHAGIEAWARDVYTLCDVPEEERQYNLGPVMHGPILAGTAAYHDDSEESFTDMIRRKYLGELARYTVYGAMPEPLHFSTLEEARAAVEADGGTIRDETGSVIASSASGIDPATGSVDSATGGGSIARAGLPEPDAPSYL